jgi:hypothetical protein
MFSFKKLTIYFMGAILFGSTVGATVGAATASAVTFSTGAHAVSLTFAGGPGHPLRRTQVRVVGELHKGLTCTGGRRLRDVPFSRTHGNPELLGRPLGRPLG